MSEWREEPEAPERDWGDVRNKALIGAACAAAVIAWMLFARPGEEASSSRGFNLGSAGGSSGRASRGEADTRPKTSLDMVSSAVGDGPAGVTNNALAPAREAAQVQAGAVEAPRTPARC